MDDRNPLALFLLLAVPAAALMALGAAYGPILRDALWAALKLVIVP